MLWPAHSHAAQAVAVFDALMAHSSAYSTVQDIGASCCSGLLAFCVLWSLAAHYCTQTMLCIHEIQASAALL
eukprot:20049-Heterococcus_DN1.PRE.2